MRQTTPFCLQVGQPSEQKPNEDQQAGEEAVLDDSEPSHAGVAEVLRAERQAARLQAEQEQAALQATVQKLEGTRQLRVAALQDDLPLGAAGLQRRRHQDASYADICAQHTLALAEAAKDRHQARTGEQPPRLGAAARKVWRVPEAIPSDPFIAYRVRGLTTGPSRSFRPALQISSLPRFQPGPAAAERPHPAGSLAPDRAASAGGPQAPLPAAHRLPAWPGATSGQFSRISGAEVQQRPVSAANSTLQQKDGLRAEVRTQVRMAATAAIDHTECCNLPCRGHPSTVAATCSCAAKAPQEHCACPSM